MAAAETMSWELETTRTLLYTFYHRIFYNHPLFILFSIMSCKGILLLWLYLVLLHPAVSLYVKLSSRPCVVRSPAKGGSSLRSSSLRCVTMSTGNATALPNYILSG